MFSNLILFLRQRIIIKFSSDILRYNKIMTQYLRKLLDIILRIIFTRLHLTLSQSCHLYICHPHDFTI